MGTSSSRGVVALASLLLTATYMLFVMFAAAAIVLWSEHLGVQPLQLAGGLGLFGALVVTELTLVLVLDRTGPFILAFLVPAIVGYVAVRQVADSETILKLIRTVESTIRTPAYVPVG